MDDVIVIDDDEPTATAATITTTIKTTTDYKGIKIEQGRGRPRTTPTRFAAVWSSTVNHCTVAAGFGL